MHHEITSGNLPGLRRRGAKHDWYRNPISGVYQAVPRHREINPCLAAQMIKKLSE
ncbi:MAG: addiction module toxin, HicA family [Gammaproteobacteria bacterium]|nr:addiction module toxin, HicA family [Gammaproteobacteria bacterium]